eukprot:365952-Pyramimonas_sp.AAC.1
MVFRESATQRLAKVRGDGFSGRICDTSHLAYSQRSSHSHQPIQHKNTRRAVLTTDAYHAVTLWEPPEGI